MCSVVFANVVSCVMPRVSVAGAGCGYYGGSGSGGRISVFAGTVESQLPATACGGPSVGSYSAGSSGTIYWDVFGPGGTATLYVSNCGLPGGASVLSDPNRYSYYFDSISIVNGGELLVSTYWVGPTTTVGVTTPVLAGDKSGRVFVSANVVFVVTTPPTAGLYTQNVSITVETGGSLTTPATSVLRGVDITVHGQFTGASTVVIDNGGKLYLFPDGGTGGMLPGNYAFENVEVNGTGVLSATSIGTFSVSGPFTVRNSASVTLTASTSGLAIVADSIEFFDTSSLVFSGAVSVVASTAFAVGSGVVFNGNGGGYASSTGACTVGSAGTGGSLGGYGAVGSAGGAAMIPCTAYEWPVTMGAGGVAWGSAGGAGGSALSISVNSSMSSVFDLNGTITVNGLAGSGGCSGSGGGGAGGSVAISASILHGTGTIKAQGAAGGTFCACVCALRVLGVRGRAFVRECAGLD